MQDKKNIFRIKKITYTDKKTGEELDTVYQIQQRHPVYDYQFKTPFHMMLGISQKICTGHKWSNWLIEPFYGRYIRSSGIELRSYETLEQAQMGLKAYDALLRTGQVVDVSETIVQ